MCGGQQISSIFGDVQAAAGEVVIEASMLFTNEIPLEGYGGS